jgi:hypothetical protein
MALLILSFGPDRLTISHVDSHDVHSLPAYAVLNVAAAAVSASS